jgi:hypothetical protein
MIIFRVLAGFGAVHQIVFTTQGNRNTEDIDDLSAGFRQALDKI